MRDSDTSWPRLRQPALALLATALVMLAALAGSGAARAATSLTGTWRCCTPSDGDWRLFRITDTGGALTGTVAVESEGRVNELPGTTIRGTGGSSPQIVVSYVNTFDGSVSTFTYTGTLSADGSTIAGTLAISPPPAFPRDPAFSMRRDGSAVSGTIRQRSCGETSCTRTPLAGVTVTATQADGTSATATTGDGGGYTLTLGTGEWTLRPSLRDAVFEPAQTVLRVVAPVSGADFETCGASPERRLAGRGLLASECPVDYEIDAVEVTQGIQGRSWYAKGDVVVPGVGKVPGGTYGPVFALDEGNEAARLVAGKPGLVRVYARLTPSGETTKVPPVRVGVYEAGRRVATLTALSVPRSLGAASGLDGRREYVDGTYNFELPAALTAGAARTLTLLAEIAPPAGTECTTRAGVDCADNNRWALAGIPVVQTRPYVLSFYTSRTPVATTQKGATFATKELSGAEAVRLAALGNGRWWLPLQEGDFQPVAAPGAVNAASALRWAIDQTLPGPHADSDYVLETCVAVPACTIPLTDALVQDVIRLAPQRAQGPMVVLPTTITTGRAGLTLGSPPKELSAAVADERQHTILHEGLHIAGLSHASSGCGADLAKPWPDPLGTIWGWGARPLAGGKLGWQVLRPADWFDVMSYCDPTRGAQTALSNIHWNDLVDSWRVRPGTTGARRTPTRAAVDGLAVSAVLAANGSAPYLQAGRVRATPTASSPTGAITVTAYDAAGTAIAAVAVDDEGGDDGYAVVDVVLPITEAARIDLSRSGWVATTVSRSANAPVVRLGAPRGGIRVAPGTRLPVVWSATDADGDAVRTRVEFSADDGRHWRVVATGLTGTSVTLPAGTLTTARRGRLRVVVSDGLRESAQTSGRFTVVGRPPTVRLTTPASTLRVKKGVAFRVAGYGYDESATPLTAGQLRWFDGQRVLGRGATRSVRLAAKGRHVIRLVGTDRNGRTTTRTAVIIVS